MATPTFAAGLYSKRRELNVRFYRVCCNGDFTTAVLLLKQGANPLQVLRDYPRSLLYYATSLHAACKYGHLECVKLIIIEPNKINPNILDSYWKTPLHLACESGHKNIILYLLTRAKSNPNLKDIFGNTPLHYVSGNGHLECLKLLVETCTLHTIDRDVSNNSKYTPIDFACFNGHSKIVRYLLARGCQNTLSLQDRFGNTPLHLASINGHLECVKLLFETQHAHPSMCNNKKQSATHLVSLYGHENVLEYLLHDRNLPSKMTDEAGNTPLHVASENGHLRCVDIITRSKTCGVLLEALNNDKHTPVQVACMEGHKDIVVFLVAIYAKSMKSKNDNDYIMRELLKIFTNLLHIASSRGHLVLVEHFLGVSLRSTDTNKQSPIHLACENGHKDIVSCLLTKCNPNIKDEDGNTLLHVACRNGQLECVKLIIETGSIDPEVINDLNQTALCLACMHGHQEIFEYLWTHAKCNPGIKDDDANSPLNIASHHGNLECLKYIIRTSSTTVNTQAALHAACRNGHKHIIDYLVTHTKCNFKVRDGAGNTLLHIASENGHFDCVKLIIESKAIDIEPDAFNNDNQTPLHLACMRNHKNVASYLLTNAKCNPSIQDRLEMTPLCIASSRGLLLLVKRIVESKNLINTSVALFLASKNGHNHVVHYLLSLRHTESDLDVKYNGNTPLQIACCNGQLECVKLIIAKYPIRVYETNNCGQTLLHLAIMEGQKGTVQYLLKLTGCKLWVRDKFGNTPLLAASENGHLDCVKLFFEDKSIGIDFDEFNDNNQTALHIASIKGHKSLVLYLLNYFPNPDMTDTNGQTPLHLACANGHRGTVPYLLTKCNPNFTDINGNTPLHVACRSGHLECVKLIMNTDSIDPEVTNNLNQTAFGLANIEDHQDIFEYLWTHPKTTISASSYCTSVNTQAALHSACRNGHKHIIDYLVTHTKCNFKVRDGAGNTLLHIASENGHFDCVKLIIESKAIDIEPDAFNNDNQTPLHLACMKSRKEIFEFLLSHAKCDPNFKDGNGRTSLQIACLNGDLEFVKLMCELNNAHSACTNGHKEFVDLLTHEIMCDSDNDESAPLHLVSRTHVLDDVKLTFGSKEVSEINKQTALRLASELGHKDIVEYLLIQTKCIPSDIVVSCLHDATKFGHLECVRLIIESNSVSIDPGMHKQTALNIACLEGHKDIVDYLLNHHNCDPCNIQTDGNTALHNATRNGHLDCVRAIIDCSAITIDPDVTNKSKQTPLHVASVQGHTVIVHCLLTHAKCSPYLKDKDGNTPLHSAIHVQSSSDHLECVKHLVTQMNPDEPNANQQTALHISCISSQVTIVNFLLFDTKCNPNVKDVYGFTPLMYAEGNPKIVQTLIRYGADTKNVYSMYGQVLGKNVKRPPEPCGKVIVVGDSGVGKTTLVEALKEENARLSFVSGFPSSRRITKVVERTAGISPQDFTSKHYGTVTFYDLAGQRDYYDCHSAVLKTFTKIRLPTVLLVIDISKSDDDITLSLFYWVNFLKNQFPGPEDKTGKLPVIVVGSHFDKVSNSSSIGEKENMVKEIVNTSSIIRFAGFVPMNCQECESSHMNKLRKKLKAYLKLKDYMNFSAHCLRTYLSKVYSTEVTAVTLAEIQDSIHDEEWNIVSFLPEPLYRLSKLCEELSDIGDILFLKDDSKLQDSWVVIDKSVILSEINGTIFAPKHSKQYKQLESDPAGTGIVPVSKLEETFRDHDTTMLVGVLQNFEFCSKVSDQFIALINKENDQDFAILSGPAAPKTRKEEKYLFFPSLVSVEAPKTLWETRDQLYQVHFGWIIQCKERESHFFPRFQSVLCNRLAFKFALASDPEEIDPKTPALHRKCSVWKNGIYWGNRQGVETLVEVDTHCKSVVLMMRCSDMSAACHQLRFEVVQTILKAVKDFCPISTTISFFPCKDICYPLKPAAELTLICLEEVKTAVSKNSLSALVKNGTPIPLKELLGFETNIDEIPWFGAFQDETLPKEQIRVDRNVDQVEEWSPDDRIKQIALEKGVDSIHLDVQFPYKHLLSIAKKLASWTAYTDYLELTPPEKLTIESDPFLTAPHHRPLEMLKTWRRKHAYSPKAHYRYLMKACLEVEDNASLAEDICLLLAKEKCNHPDHEAEDLNDRIIEIARHLGVDPTLLNQPFSEMLLLPISKRLIHWKAYADYLGLSPVEAQTIETDSHESLTVLHHRPLKVLKTWMKNNNFAGTTKDLMKACLEVGSDAELAGSVCRLSNGHLKPTQLQPIQTALSDASHKWCELGLQLQLDAATIELIEKQNHFQNEHRLKETLNRWISKEGREPPTLDQLIKALSSPSVSCPHLVEQLVAKL